MARGLRNDPEAASVFPSPPEVPTTRFNSFQRRRSTVREASTRSHDQGTEQGQPKGLAALLGGAALVAYAVYKGASRSRERDAHTAESPAPRHEALPSHIEASLTVGRPAQELY